MGQELAQLTDKQETFVEHVINGIDRTKAAELAGFAFPSRDSYRLMQNPRITAAIHAATRQHVESAAPLAVKTLVRLMDEKYAPSVQLGAAKTLLDRAGITESANKTNDLGGKSLMEMTLDELQDAYAKLASQRDSLANGAPSPGTIDAQATDIIDEGTTSEA